MSSRRAGSGARPRSRDPRAAAPREEGTGAQNPLVAGAQILLGLTLSCLIALLVFMAVIGVVAAMIYLTR